MLSNLSLVALAGILPREWRKCINCVGARKNLMTGVIPVKALTVETLDIADVFSAT